MGIIVRGELGTINPNDGIPTINPFLLGFSGSQEKCGFKVSEAVLTEVYWDSAGCVVHVSLRCKHICVSYIYIYTHMELCVAYMCCIYIYIHTHVMMCRVAIRF